MVALEAAAAAEVVPSSQIGCRGGAEAEQHHQRGAAGVASRRGWSGSTEPSLGAQVKRQHKQGGRAGGAAAERSPRLASLASGRDAPFPSRRGPRDADREAAPDLSRWGGMAPGKRGGSGWRTLRRGLPNGKAIWPGANFRVGFQAWENAGIPAGKWAAKLVLTA